VSKITSIDRKTCRDIAERVQEALEPLGKELGLSFDYKGGRFSSTSLTMKIEAATLSNDGTVNSKESETFKLMAKHYGFKAEDLGETFEVRGTVYRITGLNTRAHKMPIQADRVHDGAGYKFPVDTVLRAMGRKTKSSIPDLNF
jgi:hypothetical protein